MNAAKILIASTLLLAAWPAAASDDWEFLVAPYLWGAGLEGDVTAAGIPGEVDVSFSDIVDVLDGAVLAHFEARREGWTILGDLSFLDVGLDLEMPAGQIDLDQLIVEAGGAYRWRENVDLLFGARYTDLDVTLSLAAPISLVIDGDQSWVDPFFGARWIKPLGEDWQFHLRGDIGGFGVGSDAVWQVRTGITYRFSPLFSLAFGARLLDYDFEDGEAFTLFEYDVGLTGAEIGLLFAF